MGTITKMRGPKRPRATALAVTQPRLRGPRGVKAKQSVTPQWDPVDAPTIEGVRVEDVKNVIYKNGVLTEVFSSLWDTNEFKVNHIAHVTLLPGKTSPWHMHRKQFDLLFVVRGHIRVGLYDGRDASPTHDRSMVLSANVARPQYVIIPPGVWHALRNFGSEEAAYLAVNDAPYQYDDPDDWLVAQGSGDIPVSLE